MLKKYSRYVLFLFLLLPSLTLAQVANTCPVQWGGLSCDFFGSNYKVYQGQCETNLDINTACPDGTQSSNQQGCICSEPVVASCNPSTAANAALACDASTVKSLDYGSCSFGCVPKPPNPEVKVSVIPSCTAAGKIAKWQIGDLDYDGDGDICSTPDTDDAFYDTSDVNLSCTDAAGWACVAESSAIWTYDSNTLTYDGGDTDIVVIDDANSLLDANFELQVYGDIGADRFCSGTNVDAGNCLIISDTACTGTDILAWTNDVNGDATTGDYGWSCQSITLAANTLEALSDTDVTACTVGQILTWTTTDDGGTSLDFTDDTNEWTCEDASVVISGDSLYTGKVAGSTSVGSYVSANSLCGAEKKICTFEDILFSIRSGESLPTEQLWITNGPPGDFVGVNDCAGFTSSGSSYYGSVWVGDLSRPAIRPCNSPTNFACCNK